MKPALAPAACEFHYFTFSLIPRSLAPASCTIVNVLQMAPGKKCDSPLVLGILETAGRGSQFSLFSVAMR
jgi:hypothetical protein